MKSYIFTFEKTGISGTRLVKKLHGFLMEEINKKYPDLANDFHASGIHDYSTYVLNDYDNQKWIINLLKKDLVKRLDPILSSLEKIKLKLKEKKFIDIISKESHSLDDMHKKIIPQKSYMLNFVTPTSFKKKDNYIHIPSEELIMGSLLRSYHHLMDKEKPSENEIKKLTSAVRIKEYKIKSSYFPLHRYRIPAFTGVLELVVAKQASENIQKQIAKLLYFSELRGIGIKTSLGMGAVALRK